MVNNEDDNVPVLLREATEKALRLLSYGDKSKRGLYNRLREAGFEHGAAKAAVAKMEQCGYINDERFAEVYVARAVETKGHGRIRIERDLYEKGIDRETAAKAIDEYFCDADDDGEYRDPELSNAVDALTKRLRRIEPRELDYDEKRRAYGYLMRRGFKSDTIREAFREWGAGADDFED